MRRVYVSVEGQTEEIFVRDILGPHLVGFGVALQQVILKTKRPAGAAPGRGGVSKWSKIEPELKLLLRDSNAIAVTTMYDLYGLPTDTPGWRSAQTVSDPHQRAKQIESEIGASLGDGRLRPYLQVHEFEALLFAAPDELAARANKDHLSESVQQVVHAAGGPELINDGPTTAPSKRLAQMWPEFTKTLDGPAIVKAAGLARVRAACPRFDAWLQALEDLGT